MAKQKLGNVDLGNPDTRPSFYKITWLHNSIRVPPDFKHHLLSEETDTAILKTPSGNWDVKLQQKKGDIYFGHGWQEFVNHHLLGRAQFLVFKYNSDMSFDVVIYDKNGCERNDRSIQRSRQEAPSRFTSSFPFFRKVMKNYNVGARSTLVIPKAFQRKHLPLSKQKMILRNSEGISWQASTTVTNSKLLWIVGGWKAFSDDNSIKKDDVGIFELVEPNTIQVRIIRAQLSPS